MVQKGGVEGVGRGEEEKGRSPADALGCDWSECLAF